MAFQIIKNLTVTRVQYQLVELLDGIPVLVPKPEAVFRGVVSKERVKKLLAQRYGSDTTIFIAAIESGPHRFVMDFEDFVRGARVEDIAQNGEDTATAEASDNDGASVSDGNEDETLNADGNDVHNNADDEDAG